MTMLPCCPLVTRQRAKDEDATAAATAAAASTGPYILLMCSTLLGVAFVFLVYLLRLLFVGVLW